MTLLLKNPGLDIDVPAALQISTAANPRIVYYSTKTALTRLLKDIYSNCAADRGIYRIKSVDPWTCPRSSIILTSTHVLNRRLQWTFNGIGGSALDWIVPHRQISIRACRGERNCARWHANSAFPRVQCLALSSPLSTLHQSQMWFGLGLHHMVSSIYNTPMTLNCSLHIALKNEDSIAKLQNSTVPTTSTINWFAQNGLSLNPKKSEAIYSLAPGRIWDTSSQFHKFPSQDRMEHWTVT